jgi:hypothetical protein
VKNIGVWFKNLSRIAQVSMVSVVALSGFFVADASTQQPVNTVPPVVTTKVETETQEINFEKETKETTSLNKGVSQIETVGSVGVKTLTHTIILTDGVETSRNTNEIITTAPTNEVTLIGSYVPPPRNCDPNYSGCVPNVSYDLNCQDIGHSVEVYGYDSHGLDRDNDGYGCE